jgi:hypothetical protein
MVAGPFGRSEADMAPVRLVVPGWEASDEELMEQLGTTKSRIQAGLQRLRERLAMINALEVTRESAPGSATPGDAVVTSWTVE